MLKNLKSVAKRPEAFTMRRQYEASVAMRCHPEARLWPKDLNAKCELDFGFELLRAQTALRMTLGQRV